LLFGERCLNGADRDRRNEEQPVRLGSTTLEQCSKTFAVSTSIAELSKLIDSIHCAIS
jgi:hypothetical protein